MASVDIDKLVRLGEVLAGKYRIERIIGQGGMGVVVAAHHVALDQRVAIKFLLPEAVKRADLVARFEREARAAVKIKSEHVAHVLDVGVLESGSPYMVMEYLEGIDLEERLEQQGPISIEETADFVLQACEAIAEAHALGIVHRDLKPANLFLIRGADGLPSIKVLDFGVAKAGPLGTSDPAMTQTRAMLGSPFYMSPEQCRSSKNVDMRTDIWALGIILYQCVSGVVPFDAETLSDLVLKIVNQPLAALRVVRPDVSSAFEHVVARCLEKAPERRYQHIGELATALVGFAPERGRASADRIMRVMMAAGMAPVVALPPSASRLPLAPTPSTPPFVDTNGSFGNTNRAPAPPPNRATRSSALIAGLAGAALVLLLVSVYLGKSIVERRQAQGSATASVSAPTVMLTASAPVPPTPSASFETAPPPQAVIDAGALSLAEGSHDAGAEKRTIAPTAPTALPSSRVPLPASSTTKPSCNPPYYIDAKGNHVFKKECV